MHLSLSLFSGASVIILFSLVALSHGDSVQRLLGGFESKGLRDSITKIHERPVDIGSAQGYTYEISEDPDFEDDDPDVMINLFDSDEEDIRSLTHLHKNRGEILVPCFGMWWPVGGGATYDYYGGDYYGDYKRKKRRRSRKKKKAAKMKKKKS